MQFLKIVGLAVCSAVVYGIVHDQFTARICVEYFTIGHPPIGTDDPTLLAFGWGVLATWWAGLLLGVPLAIAARAGRRPQLNARGLVRPIGMLLFIMFVGAIIAGVAGCFAASRGWIVLHEPLSSRVPIDRHTAFLTNWFAHAASYLVGFTGGIVLIVKTTLRRRALHRATFSPSSSRENPSVPLQ